MIKKILVQRTFGTWRGIMMRGMNKRRKHSCVNTLNKSLLVNTFIGNLNMPSLEKVQLYGTSLSRNAIHTTTYHGAISISMYTHISRLNATPYTPECTCVHTSICALLPPPVAYKPDNCESRDLATERIPVCSRCFGPLCVKISA